MKKKFFALMLGGVMAAGSLFAQTSAVAQAAGWDDLKSEHWQNWISEYDCEGLSDAHIKSSSVDVVNGFLTVKVDVESESHSPAMWGGAVYVSEEKWEPDPSVGDGESYYDFLTLGSTATESKFFLEGPECVLEGNKGNIKFTFDELTPGKTYYVYCQVADPHDESEAMYMCHWAVELGSGTPTAAADSSADNENSADNGASTDNETSSGNASSGSASQAEEISYEDTIVDEIAESSAGATVKTEEGISALSNSVMKELLKKGDVSLRMEFTYDKKDYVIIIPAGAALDNDIPWYGPLYLAQHFGNSAGTAAAKNGTVYEVKLGDSMSKIAKANNMTLEQLLAKNPQVKDPNKIMAGQKINR
ncbi:MAG: LysM domain-containing protein [Bacteroidales bacterium]|nr:LysM domain-containing protein [Lachnoclostridium sp.]MCM1383567.1 LysM domain-containing protein [Lachnoclostridium sp.]MCM1464150.1 LysM domain-containing protein [Bacteroidales bacterium]